VHEKAQVPRERVVSGTAHDRAAELAGTRLDEPFGLQDAQRFAYRAATDAGLADELALSRQRRPVGVCALQNLLAKMVCDDIAGLGDVNALELDRHGWWRP